MSATGFPQPQFRKFQSNSDAKTAERDTLIWQARIRGIPAAQIAQQLGINPQDVHDSVSRAAKAIRLENAPEIIKAEVERIDTLLMNAIEVLEKTHYTTSHGKVLYHPETKQPLEDSAPILKAIDTIIKLMERRSKLLGLDAPSRTEHAVNLTQTSADDLALMDMINATKAKLALGLQNLTNPDNGQ